MSLVTLNDTTGAQAVIAPELGGWLLRYGRPIRDRGLVEALHFEQAVADRYPTEMYAGNPLLFPMVSFNHLPDREHHYEWQGRVHPLPQHGFARKVPWSVTAQDAAAVTMEITDNESTRAAYPFAFRHRVTYRLAAGRLHFEQTVENRGGEPLPFSTGIHPYFPVPFARDGAREACFIEVPDATLVRMDERYETFATKPFAARRWSVAHDVAATMFLADLSRRELAVVDPACGLRIVLNWEGAPQHRYVAIWAKSPAASFYCLEPWTALPNSFKLPENGLLTLAPGEVFRAAMWIELQEIA